MNALPIIILALCIYAIAYRYYSAFIAAKVLALDDQRITPAHTMYDGQNYVPTNKWVLFGHHFAAITGAGPLIGPVLAAQFGFLPGLLWLVIGVCLGGAVHDFIILSSSIRRGGKSLAEMARTEISPITGIVAAIAILFIIVMALSGLGLAVVNALHDSSWGAFTIACGAISGFHALIGSGTTPKMIDKETHARPIGYGAMLIESLVGVTALIAATALHPADYFAINVPIEKFANLGLSVVHLPELEQQVGETVTGRTGGAVSLAVGMAQIFTALPGMKGLMAYWYHFAIMFEALFILTTIDTGTRVARFLVQEFLGKFYKPLERTNWMPGTVISSALVCAAWAYFIYTGSISQIWPMFGVANQLLAAIALAVGTTIIINAGKARNAWVTIVPLSFVGTTTLVAGWKNITDNFLPLTKNPALAFQGYLDAALTAIIMVCAVIVFANSIFRWYQVLSGKRGISPKLATAVEGS